jgi:3-phenylpropionate/trans-cinnamate dioxygenase ferredoxin reductase subunit
MSALRQIVIVGGGQACAQAVDTLRRRGYDGGLTLLSDEPHLPYQRPPLSKKFLAGSFERDRLLIRHAGFYSEHRIDVRLGYRVVQIDRDQMQVSGADGSKYDYDTLLLATGSRPRRLSIEGADLQGVHYLRTIADVDRLGRELVPGRRIVIVGGGYIGLEVAATCRERGLEVTVLEMSDRLMNRVVCPEISSFYEEEHARRGVDIVCRASVQGIHGDEHGRVRSIICSDGNQYIADIVLIGVGALPNDDLAVAAGLDCANGIMVDAHCRTSDPRIYAAGDCALHRSHQCGGSVRLESVDNAFEQGTNAALAMLGESPRMPAIPWFWSDQYDLKLIIVGLSTGYDRTVLRGRPFDRSFSVCYLRDGELIAMDTINNAKDQMAARKLVGQRNRPILDRLADTSRPLRDCF